LLDEVVNTKCNLTFNYATLLNALTYTNYVEVSKEGEVTIHLPPVDVSERNEELENEQMQVIYQPPHNFVALFKSDNPGDLELLATELAKLGEHGLGSILDFDIKISTGEKKTKLLPAAVRQKLDNLKTLVQKELTQQLAQNHSNQYYFLMSIGVVMVAAGAMLYLHNQNYLTKLFSYICQIYCGLAGDTESRSDELEDMRYIIGR
ncbi:MAG: hypothetical protein AAF153_02220, partial [Pseudomonadota bacterium]